MGGIRHLGSAGECHPGSGEEQGRGGVYRDRLSFPEAGREQECELRESFGRQQPEVRHPQLLL